MRPYGISHPHPELLQYCNVAPVSAYREAIPVLLSMLRADTGLSIGASIHSMIMSYCLCNRSGGMGKGRGGRCRVHIYQHFNVIMYMGLFESVTLD